MTRRRAILLIAASLGTLATATAIAAPDHTGTVTAGAPAFTWEGGPISGSLATTDVYLNVPCDAPGNDCDDTLLNVSVSGGGTAQGSVKITGPANTDLDLFVYRSDANGEPGAFVKSSAGSTANEQVTFEVDPGYYLVRVYAATAAAATYKGEAKVIARPLPGEVNYGVDPADPGAGQSGGGSTTLSGDLAPTSTVRAPRSSRPRVLTGTARDADGKVAYVDVAVVRKLSRSCLALTATGRWRKLAKCSAPRFLRAKGTTRWRLTLPRGLTKGLYIVSSRATDNLGRREAGFDKRNQVRFRIT
jgi:hypothetical protein